MKCDYRLQIVDDKGSVFSLVGGNDLRQVAEAWANSTFEPADKFAVSGFSDSGDRKPITIALERETVKGVILEEL